MCKHHIEPNLRRSILKMLRTWYKEGRANILPGFGLDLTAAMEEQADIGGFNFLLGRVSNKISIIQHHYVKSKGLQKTGDSWTANFIVQLWSLSRAMWEHRNLAKHDNDNPDKLVTREDIMDQVQVQIDMGNRGILSQDLPLFPRDLVKFQTRTNAQLLQWLSSIQQARRAFHHHQLQQSLQTQQQQQSMQTWLQHGSINAPTTAERQHMEGLHLQANPEDSDDENYGSDESYNPDDESDNESVSFSIDRDSIASISTTDIATELQLLRQDLETTPDDRQPSAPQLPSEEEPSILEGSDDGSTTTSEGTSSTGDPPSDHMDSDYAYSTDDSL